MLRFVMKKMYHSKWLFICLIFAAVTVNALICSISIYSRANASRILNQDFNAIIEDENKCPGEAMISCEVGLHLKDKSPFDVFKDFETKIVKVFKKNMGLPKNTERIDLESKNAYVMTKAREKNKLISASFSAIKDMEKHIKILKGTSFSENSKDQDIIEILVEKKAYSQMEVAIGEELTIIDQYAKKDVDNLSAVDPSAYYKARIVGVFEQADDGTSYWKIGPAAHQSDLLISYDAARNKMFKEHPDWFGKAYWCTDYDVLHMSMSDAEKTLKCYEQAKDSEEKLFPTLGTITTQYDKVLTDCMDQEAELKRDIALFMLPVIVMLGIFIFMITQFIVNGDKNEIATLSSRGAGKKNILSIYMMEGLIISGGAIILGPLAAILICKMLGSSSGFLEFTQRKPLLLKIDTDTYAYSLAAQLLFMSNMLVPVIMYANVSILEHSRRGTNKKRSLWKWCGLDFICIGTSMYFIYKYFKKAAALAKNNMDFSVVGIDPGLYLAATLLILGITLLFLRLYPYLIRLVSVLGRKYWSPAVYATFKNIGRVSGDELFIMLFMIMAISIGILNANEARSYNQYKKESICYDIGADVVITPEWKDFNEALDYSYGPSDPNDMQGNGIPGTPDFWEAEDLDDLLSLPCAEETCKFSYFEPYAAYVDGNAVNGNYICLASLQPYKFGKTAWSKSSLWPVHINEYLNIMTKCPNAVFVTANILKTQKAKIGDEVKMILKDSKGNEIGKINYVISGFVNYWPGIPTKNDEGKDMIFFIGSFQYLQNYVGTRPYQIWMKKAQGISDAEFLEKLTKEKLVYEDIEFMDSNVVTMKNDPYNMGVNGTLTLAFMIIMLIAAIGFIIYWILVIKERSLQFGIMRALGMSKGSVLRMLGLEQLLLFGSSILMGIIVGSSTSQLIVPLLQKLGRKISDTYPVVVAYNRGDYLKVYGLTFLILGISMLVIMTMMRKIKMAEILKLGEDR